LHRNLSVKIGWYLSDTTESLASLAAGSIDIAVTYNKAAEMQSLKTGACVQRKCGFLVGGCNWTCSFWLIILPWQDQFYLVGPRSNPANLDGRTDDVLTMFNKIVIRGNADVAVSLLILYLIEH
jgi:ABC-type tungstate transport system permease subunit